MSKTTMPKVLLAKTPRDRGSVEFEETLVGHTKSVCEVADYLAEMLANALAQAIRCNPDTVEHWRKAVIAGAWIHDWGKANDHFQRLMRGSREPQGIRHEALSLILAADELKSWLSPLWGDMPRWARAGAIFAASGHHLKFPDPTDDRPGTKVTLFMGHSDFTDLLQTGAEKLGLAGIPVLQGKDYSLLSRGNLRKTLKRLRRELDIDFTDTEKVLISTIKSTVMAADVAGSALPRSTDDPVFWLRERLEKTLSVEQLQRVVNSRLRGSSPLPFQRLAQDAADNTVLLEAGCGSGKTAAAYLWASRRAAGRRLFFCYPTTGTASEGFAGYLFDPDFDAILVHSRADVDYRLLDNMPDPNHEENELRQSRLEALETWPIPAVVCTAHTVLGLLENVRRGLYAWPSLARAVFVFDEIHAFSDRLFSYLLRFVQTFSHVPMFLMTATLPPSRKEALEDCCKSRGGLRIIGGPAKREAAKRYRLVKVVADAAWHRVRQELDCGRKVLWVCNTVGRCMSTVDRANEMGLRAEPFHSRYRYKDRLKRQRTVIDGFIPGKPSILAVTTQVAEMSLDLSANLLVSEYAPIPAMIQRLGRLNRFEGVPPNTAPALFIEPPSNRPYDEELWRGVEEWLDSLCDDQPLSQKELAEAFVEISSIENVQPAIRCEWLDGLWESSKGKRAIEEAGYTIEVVREEDLPTDCPAENAIPMPFPRNDTWRKWDREGRFFVAPKGTMSYDETRGARWQNT